MREWEGPALAGRWSMRIASLAFLVLLGGAPLQEESPKRFLDQKEWYGRVVCKMRGSGHRASGGDGTRWSLKRTAIIEFKLKLDPAIGMMAPYADLIKKSPTLTDKQRKEFDKNMLTRRWVGDLKVAEQTEDLSLNESLETWGICPGGEGCPLKKLRCGKRESDSRKAEGKENRVVAVGNGLTIDTSTGTFKLDIRWTDSVPGTSERTVDSEESDAPPSVPPTKGNLPLGFGNIHISKGNLPEKGLVLSGGYKVNGPSDYKARGRVSWTLSPKPLPPVELKFELANYEDWRPRGGTSEGEVGNEIPIHAWLEGKNGGAVEDKAVAFIFELEEVTREKGVCINFPPTPKDPPDPDLRFLASSNPGFVAPGGTSAQKHGKNLLEATAVLSSYDWGAWGKVKVRAYLESGREVIGSLRDDEDMTEAPVPKSRDGSWIADSWRKLTGAQGDDNVDDDNEPLGDGIKGDGLTLYEEYRGWHEGGRRLNNEFDGGGDPKTKEFFICDRSGKYTKAAIKKFSDLSKLRVIWNLEQAELNPVGVINFNRTAGPHRVDQHGIFLMHAPGLSRSFSGIALGDTLEPGPPREKRFVLFRNAPGGDFEESWDGSNVNPEIFDATITIVHELLHCCNVYHHGRATTEFVNWTLSKDPQATNPLREGAVTIRVMDEETKQDVTEDIIAILRLYERVGAKSMTVAVGVWTGPQSGDPRCAMAYSGAEYFASRTDPGLRYRIRAGERGAKALGTFGLCSSGAPAGTNAPHDPEGHFGPAAKKGKPADPRAAAVVGDRGNCVHQIMVNDAISKPYRR